MSRLKPRARVSASRRAAPERYMISMPKTTGPSAEPEPKRLSAPFSRLDTFAHGTTEVGVTSCQVAPPSRVT